LKVLGIVGWSGSGKTTLLTAMITALKVRGLSVSTIKHAHHALELDKPGKDSYRHRHAGAEETILANAARFALFSEHRDRPEPDLGDLLARLAPVDLVLVEGFKSYEFPKLEVHRPALGKPALWPEMTVMAVASDSALADCPVPVLDLNRAEAVTDFVLGALGLISRQVDQES
jgi:molybdopterin-guanine dinucleotide biosynthesis protein B